MQKILMRMHKRRGLRGSWVGWTHPIFDISWGHYLKISAISYLKITEYYEILFYFGFNLDRKSTYQLTFIMSCVARKKENFDISWNEL